MNTNPIDAVNAAVQAALAKAQAQTQAQAPVVQAQTHSAPPVPYSAPRSLTDALNSAGTAADKWLSVNEYGLFTGDKKVIFPAVMVEIDLTKVRFGQGVRWTMGSNQTQYAKSWDMVREAQTNEPWAEVVAKARNLDSKCRGAYDLADIPMTVTEDAAGNALPGADPKSDRTITEGTTLAYTTSITGYAPFMSFVRAAVAAHGPQAIVKAKVTGESKTKGANTYGIMKFELLD